MTNNNPHQVVVAKALTDPAFRADLLKNTNAAVEKALGIKIPAGVTVKVVQDTASEVHLVIPAALENKELSESDLGKVAGGAASSGLMGCRANTQYKVC